jgi:membrane protein DedA with SNARE-associated domain
MVNAAPVLTLRPGYVTKGLPRPIGPGRAPGPGGRAVGGERGLTEDLIAQLGYIGFFLVLVLGGFGLPVPEEVPIILAGVLSRKATLWLPLAYASCLLGVLVGDFVVYFLGYFYGERVLSLPLTRKFLTKAREAQIKGYFHRHGIKILIVGRFAVGFRTAAYLTAGILKLPALRLFLTDLFAATLSTTLMFAFGYFFARQIEQATQEIHRWQRGITIGVAVGLATWLLIRFYKIYKARRTIGLAVGPPVLIDDAPLPPDDLRSGTFATNLAPSGPEPATPAADAAGDVRGSNGQAPHPVAAPPALGTVRLEEKSG